MKFCIKKMLALLLALAMVLPWLPAGASAVLTDQGLDKDIVHTDSDTYINPLYADVLTAEDLNAPDHTGGAIGANAEEEPVYADNFADAAVAVREGMEQRLATVVTYYKSAQYVKEDHISVYDAAVAHTGVPTEGDSLRWVFGGYKVSISYYQDVDGMYYITYTYAMTYYTTAEQEAELTEAVEALLVELDLDGRSDYRKVRAVYDYMCENIVYDETNPSDYMLKHTAYAALIDKTCVCQGYAVLFYRLMLELGIDARLISGIGNGGAHGWNIVKLGDVYYNLDSTWDATWCQAGYDYEFFLRSDDTFGDHTRDEEYLTEEFYAAYPMAEADYVIPTTVASGECGDNLTWTLDSEGLLLIEGTGDMWDYESYEDVPWYDYRSSIETVVINAGVTSIGSNAFFWYPSLREITIPDSVTSIGDYSLMDCDKITHLEIPNSVTYIGDYALCDLDGITQVVIPENVTHINAHALSYCSNLTEITIPAAVTGIGDYAFAHCDGLTEIHFTGDAPTIESTAFSNVTATCYYPVTASGWTADVMQNYGGTLTWVPYGQFDIGYASMTMGNSLAMNFAFEQGHVSDWTGHYAQITKVYADGRADVVETVPYANWKSTTINSVAHYYVTFSNISAKEMTDNVYVTIYNAEGTAVSNTWTDSVRAQAMRNLAKSTITDLEKTMVVDMLNYGAAAQEYFSYNTADLATSELSDEQKAYATASTSYEDTHTGDENYFASNLVLKSNIQLMFAFRNVTTDMHAVITFTNHWGTAKTVTVEGSDFTANGSYYIVTVENMVVADARQDITCTVYDGETVVATATDSVESYTARKSDTLFDLLMRFSDSAYNYFHS